MKQPRPKIVVLGRMCEEPVGGVVWQVLHYMLGFERLGFESYYVEWRGNWVADPFNRLSGPRIPRVLVGEVMQQFGFADRWICRADHVADGHTFGGMRCKDLPKLYAQAEAVINLTGSHILDEDQLRCTRRVYLETDPGVPQIKLNCGDPKIWNHVRAHTHHFTFAENLYNPDCLLPHPALAYYPTRQPVLWDFWETSCNTHCRNFTTISNWMRESRKTVEFCGEVYPWSKALEFIKFLDLPNRSPQPFELALSRLGPGDKKLLERHGWLVADAMCVSSSLAGYRQYIWSSRGELTVAKDQNIRLRSGWFSDRSACYLAAGKPVITQDTGFGNVLPTGEGLFAFRTMDDILRALDAVNGDYQKHSQAAREIAREHFDARKVLGDLLHGIGLEPAVANNGRAHGGCDPRTFSRGGMGGANEVLDHLLEATGEPGVTELRRTLQDLLGDTSAPGRVVVQQKLRRPHVYRVRISADGGLRSLVVKRLTPEVAQLDQRAANRWLPAVGLRRLGPPLIGIAAERDGQCVWHIYEDLGECSLAGAPASAMSGNVELDVGFLSSPAVPWEPQRVEAAVEAIAQIHLRFAEHALLGECRLFGGDLGSYFYTSAVRDARHSLQALLAPELALPMERRALLGSLLERVERLLEEQAQRLRVLAESGGPETLLHGDLSPKNVMILPGEQGLHARLIDWDHAGVGPVSYDLSNFLAHFPRPVRQWILDRYLGDLARMGWHFAATTDWNLLFDTAECARLANSIIWRAAAVLESRAEWAFDDLVLLDQWFRGLQPVLPAAAVGEELRQ